MRQRKASPRAVTSLLALCFSAALSSRFAEAQTVERVTRVFDLSALGLEPNAFRGEDFSLPEIGATTEGSVFERQPSFDSGIHGSLALSGDDGDDVDPEEGTWSGAGVRLDPEVLLDTIVRLIDPDSWDNDRNVIELGRNLLIVTQRPSVIERIEAFLEQLHRRAARKIILEAAVVPTTTLDATLEGWREVGASPWAPGDLIERAVAHGAEEATYFSGLFQNGQFRVLTGSERIRSLADLDVDHSGVIPVLNPSVRQYHDGAELHAIPRLLAAGRAARIDFRVREISIDGKSAHANLARGKVELSRRRHDLAATSLVLPLGVTAIASVHELTLPRGGKIERDGRVVLLRSRVVGEIPASTKRVPRALDAGAVLQVCPRFSADVEIDTNEFSSDDDTDAISKKSRNEGEHTFRRIRAHDFDQLEYGGRFLIRSATLAEALTRQLSQEEREKHGFDDWYPSPQGVFHVSAPDGVHDRLRAALEAKERELLRLVEIDFWSGPVTKDDLPQLGAASGFVDASWLAKLASAPGRRQRVVCLREAQPALLRAHSRAAVVETKSVSGGTGFTIQEVSDPVIRDVVHGSRLSASVRGVPGFPWVQLAVSGRECAPPSFDRTAKAPAVEGDAGSKKAKRSMTFDLPETIGLMQWQHQVTVELGKPILLRITPGEDGQAQALIAVVRQRTWERAATR